MAEQDELEYAEAELEKMRRRWDTINRIVASVRERWVADVSEDFPTDWIEPEMLATHYSVTLQSNHVTERAVLWMLEAVKEERERGAAITLAWNTPGMVARVNTGGRR